MHCLKIQFDEYSCIDTIWSDKTIQQFVYTHFKTDTCFKYGTRNIIFEKRKLLSKIWADTCKKSYKFDHQILLPAKNRPTVLWWILKLKKLSLQILLFNALSGFDRNKGHWGLCSQISGENGECHKTCLFELEECVSWIDLQVFD